MDSDCEYEETPNWKGVSGTVLLLNLFDPISSNYVANSLKSVCHLLRNYMRYNNAQLVGVCAYGFDGKKNSSDESQVVQIIPLSVPTLEDFKKLNDMCLSDFTQPKEFKLSEVLWQTNKMFSNCKKLMSTKTVILLTMLNTPPIEADQKPALKRVVDLIDSGIKVQIINVSEESENVDDFYKIFLTEANKGYSFEIPKPLWHVQEIVSAIHKHTHRHFALANLNFEIAEGFSVGVGLFNLLQTNVKPRKVIVDKETNQIATRTTTNMKVQCDNDIDVNENENIPKEVPLLKSELLYYQIFGDEKIEFSVEEMKKLRNPFGPPMMKLLGFKPAHILCKEKWYMKPCNFLYPSENKIEGSTVAFKAFHQACSDINVIAICVLCTRVNSRPKIVALLPCSRPLGLDISIGFDIIPVPYTENVKNIPQFECDKPIDAAHKIVIKDIINKLKFDYNDDTFENPCLQSLHRAIEALALEEEDVQSYEDTTKSNNEKCKAIDAELFEEIFGPFGVSAKKRPATFDRPETSKKEKIVEVDEELLLTRLNFRQIEKYNVTELKDILKAKKTKNMPALTGLKKNELVQLVYGHVKQ